MKLYAHPASTTSRPIMMSCADQNIPVQTVMVDLFTGAHLQPDYLRLNPNGLVPLLDDDGFLLTESSAILKYLADKTDSPCYPKDLKARARVNELMDWFNTGLYREIAYHLTYPQVFPGHARATEEETRSVVEWGLERAQKSLEILDRGWTAFPDGGPYLTGSALTIADYFGVELTGCANLIHANWDHYPNIKRWFEAMRACPAWGQVHEVFEGFCASTKEKAFTTII